MYKIFWVLLLQPFRGLSSPLYWYFLYVVEIIQYLGINMNFTFKLIDTCWDGFGQGSEAQIA